MADYDNDPKTWSMSDDLVPVNYSIHFCNFLLPLRLIPFFPTSLGNSKSQIVIGDARGKNCHCEKKRERERSKKRRGKKGREKAKVNGVAWPKDAKLPKRSTRKA